MDFEWDPLKAEANLRKHRVTFEFATGVLLGPNRLDEKDDRDYDGELREIAVGRIQEFILVVVDTMRGTTARIISARRSTRHEYFKYWNGQVSA